MLVLGRADAGAAVDVVGLASADPSGRLVAAVLPLPGFAAEGPFLAVDGVTVRFVAGRPLLSPSRGRFVPAKESDRDVSFIDSEAGVLLGDSSLVDAALEPSCFLLVDAAALSRIFWARSFTG